jgi:hypothetical protein
MKRTNVVLGVTVFFTASIFAQDDNNTRALRGLQLAPVPLNMVGKDPQQVGLGAYLVNAIGGCNDCHSNPAYDPTGDPFHGQAKKFNTTGYLAGGQPFGPFTSRNITPDATGEVAGSLANFLQIMRTGIDLDRLHPQISPLLQVMPWPVYQNMSDNELKAIYAYLTSLPCVEGGLGEPANRCGNAFHTTTKAVAGPKNATVLSREYQLDGSGSTSADGGKLTYQWSLAQGSQSAAILHGDSATPTIQFGRARGTYTFQLTVTDSKGATSTDTVSVNFMGS